MANLEYTLTKEPQPSGLVRFHLEANAYQGRKFKLPLHAAVDIERDKAENEDYTRSVEQSLIDAAYRTLDDAGSSAYA